MNNKKAIVIGAGIGGIATAIRLAVKGFEVDIYEKNEVAGGKMYLIEKGGYQFDAGPSLFTQPSNIEELFHLAGEDIRSYFTYESVPIACRYFFENGIKVNAYTQAEQFAEEMNRQTGEPIENVIRYLKDSERVYEKVGSIFLNYSLHRTSTWFNRRIIDAMRTVRIPYLFKTLDQFNKERFNTPEAVQIFNRYATYNGSNPYSAPGMLSLIPHLEQNQGTFYPHGGMINIPKSLIALAEKKGVRFHLNTAVDEIRKERGKVTGVVINGKFLSSDLVVSNVDAYYTYKNLLRDEAGAKRILRNERSSSALIFYWGMKRQFRELHLHNIFFSNNYEQEFHHLFKLKKCYDDPTVYVNITSKMESGQCPDGKENWFVMVNAPAKSTPDWELDVKMLREAILT
ncbi:MAG: phytoene desaturase family protein, partial [bacterium]